MMRLLIAATILVVSGCSLRDVEFLGERGTDTAPLDATPPRDEGAQQPPDSRAMPPDEHIPCTPEEYETPGGQCSPHPALSNLTTVPGGMQPAFMPTARSYIVVVSNTVTMVRVTPQTAQTERMIFVNEVNIASGESFDVPLNGTMTMVNVRIQSFDGLAMRTYMLSVRRDP